MLTRDTMVAILAIESRRHFDGKRNTYSPDYDVFVDWTWTSEASLRHIVEFDSDLLNHTFGSPAYAGTMIPRA